MLNKIIALLGFIAAVGAISSPKAHAYADNGHWVLTLTDLAEAETECLATGCCGGMAAFVSPQAPFRWRDRAMTVLNEVARRGLQCPAHKAKADGK